MNVSITALEWEEVDILCALAREIWHAHYPPIIGLAQTEYMLAQRYTPAVIYDELRRSDVWWDVLKVDGVMIGFGSSFASEGSLKLDKLYVHPAHQRQGYGGRLIAHACDRAKRLGLDRVFLAVNKHNSSAIAAYRKHGFDVVDAVVKDIGGGFVMDDYVMEKRVEAS